VTGQNDGGPAFERALVVAAHPDDPEFGFGATVAKLADDGVDVYYVICTDGSQGGEDPAVPDEELIQTRYREQREAAGVLGVKDVDFLGFRDGHLMPDLSLRRAIVREIRRRRPDLVLTQTPVREIGDFIGAFHPDHIAAGEATLQAVYPDARNPRAFRELLAEGLVPHVVREVWLPAFGGGDHAVDVGGYVERKVEAVSRHASQLTQSRHREDGGPQRWIEQRLRAQGERVGYEYAEVFRRMRTG
jgi:LmbE family N-acetylglucosaminyl deacetylase